MIYTISNEDIFQVLSSSFSIGPSETGYELQVGADSRSFTTLFSVGANTPRMVTNVANGSYFRLKNNTGNVKVNWERVCSDDSGGGFDPSVLEPYWTSAQTKDYVDEAVSGISLDGYWTSAQTQSAITIVEDHLYDVEQVTASALTELHDGLMEVSGRSVSTEEIELPIAAAVNDLKGNIEARLSQKYYTRQEVNDIATGKTDPGQVNVQIKDYVDPAIAGVNDTIEDKELPVSAALNNLNEDIATIDEVIPAAIVDINDRMVSSSNVKTIWRGTQAEYDAITTKDPNTFYIIVNN